MTVSSTLTDPIFNARVGFGSLSTGGAAGDVVEITTLADSGPGSLRDSVASGKWVVPAPGLTGTINFGSYIQMPGDITLDLPGITLSGAYGGNVLKFASVNNIILNGFTIDGGTVNWDQDSEGQDLVQLENVDTFLIRKLTLRRAKDGLIDSPSNSGTTKSTNGTIMECRMSEVFQGNLIYGDRITFFKNYAVNVRRRFPEIVNGGLHMVDNVIDASWSSGEILHAKTDQTAAFIMAEYNYWTAGTYKNVGKKTNGGKINFNDAKGANGVVFIADDSTPAAFSAFVTEGRSLIPAAQWIKPANNTEWAAMRTAVIAGAGAV